MSITATTLSAAIGANDTVIGVAAVTYITAGNPATGSGVTQLMIDQEILSVNTVGPGTQVGVSRGQAGTQARAHGITTPVFAGAPGDFVNFVPAQGATSVFRPERFKSVGPPLTGATIAVTSDLHHYTGTTQLATITVPTDLVIGGEVTLVFDGSGAGLTWSAGGNINVAGTSTTAGSSVTFRWDTSISKWIPSRLA